ncbi:hypothetical protein BUALT_Bualt05G0099700 [Buddleja alternifolia]|uniref:DUF1664 domain-containing protein n=1 Tax=Buddleja alternifolia TaxID=168488 RepID=A0AAV6XJK0_9LAMI|nr:hypothetical protein BUALT_Bualt05G0099700 [Buddleja alternifolia]
MAMQTGVAASKVLVLVGAGVTGSVILRSGHLSDLISHLQELIKRINEAETSPGKYDAALLAAQDWSFSDIMFVTKHNMENAVASVSKQLEHVSEALSSTKRHLTKRLENLDWKLDEQREISKLVVNDVSEVRSNLNQIGYDIGLIHEMVSGLEGKIELLESKQDLTNSGLWYLCQAAGSIKDGQSSKIIQDVGAKLLDHSTVIPEGERVKVSLGLQFIVGTDESSPLQKTTSSMDGKDIAKISAGKVPAPKMRIHRSYPVGLSFAQNIVG